MFDADDVTFPSATGQMDWLFVSGRLFKRVHDKWVEVPLEDWPQACDCEDCKEAWKEIENEQAHDQRG